MPVRMRFRAHESSIVWLLAGRFEEGRPTKRFGLRDDQWGIGLPGREGHVEGRRRITGCSLKLFCTG